MNFPDDFVNILNYWCLPPEIRDTLTGPGALDKKRRRLAGPDQSAVDRVLDVQMIMGEYSNGANLSFTWNITAAT